MIKEDMNGWFIFAVSPNDNEDIAYCDSYSNNLYGAFNQVVELILEDLELEVYFIYTIAQSPF